MYYEEKVINGVLMCRTSPKGSWEVKIRTLTQEEYDVAEEIYNITDMSEEMLEKALAMVVDPSIEYDSMDGAVILNVFDIMCLITSLRVKTES